jgi:hypothetical protein
VPELKGVERERLHRALFSVLESTEVVLRAAGASDKDQRAAKDTLVRVASIAMGDSTETAPGRKLPWWRCPPPR